MSQSQVMDWLWPDADGDAAYRALITTLSRLRKILQYNQAILLSGGVLRINSELCWVDSLRFLYFVRMSERGGMKRNATKRIKCAERARELYKGEFLPYDHDAWILPVREKLKQQYADLINISEKDCVVGE